LLLVAAEEEMIMQVVVVLVDFVQRFLLLVEAVLLKVNYP
tara:strand:+ start:29 stop:148 length:120 start_codon:yes stop_codon:yes gene_type:complete